MRWGGSEGSGTQNINWCASRHAHTVLALHKKALCQNPSNYWLEFSNDDTYLSSIHTHSDLPLPIRTGTNLALRLPCNAPTPTPTPTPPPCGHYPPTSGYTHSTKRFWQTNNVVVLLKYVVLESYLEFMGREWREGQEEWGGEEGRTDSHCQKLSYTELTGCNFVWGIRYLHGLD